MQEKESEKLKKEIEENKINFNKKFEELNNILKEEIGEDNKHFYRISLIIELIKHDVDEVLNNFEELYSLSETVDELYNEMSELKSYVEKKESTKLDIDDSNDPLSDIVKDVNSLEEYDKYLIRNYIKGYSQASKRNKLKSKR